MLLISLAFSCIIFISGILLGMGLDRFRINDVIVELDRNEFERESYIIEGRFLELFGENKCTYINTRLNDLSNDLVNTGKILNEYEVRGIFSGIEYKNLKDRYSLSEIRLYILLKEIKEECGLNRPVVLFFYDQEDRLSKQQGYALDSVVRKIQNITILSIDRELDAAIVRAVKIHYNVTKSPTVIINFDEKIEGYINVDEILNIIDKK